MNEIIILINIIITGMLLLTMYHFYEKKGLYIFLIIVTILSYLTSFGVSTIIGTDINTSILFFPYILLTEYLIISKYPKEKHNKLKNYISLTTLITLITLLIICIYNPIETSIHSLDLKKIFLDNYIILWVYPLSIVLTIILSEKIIPYLKKIYNNKFITQILIYVILSPISLITMFAYSPLIAIKTYMLGLILTAINVPLINYILTKKKVTEWT